MAVEVFIGSYEHNLFLMRLINCQSKKIKNKKSDQHKFNVSNFIELLSYKTCNLTCNKYF